MPGDDQLKRSVSLPILVLYGLGTTIGAGIYVLIGAAAGYAGIFTPIAFILSALVIVPTAGSFAELSARFPVSAGEAAYVDHGFGAATLSLIVGCGIAGAGIVSSAALVQGAVGYLGIFISLNQQAVALAIVVMLGAVAQWWRGASPNRCWWQQSSPCLILPDWPSSLSRESWRSMRRAPRLSLCLSCPRKSMGCGGSRLLLFSVSLPLSALRTSST